MNPDPLRLRRAALADLSALVQLEEASFAADRFPRRNLAYLLSKANAEIVVATDGARIIGYAVVLFRKDARVARLYSIAVAPDARGRGVGEALLSWAEDKAKRRATRLRLEVRADNRQARRIYARRGYLEIGRRESYYQDGEAAIVMERALAPERYTGKNPT